MAYFKDLSDYEYDRESVRARTKTVGWLARGHRFPVATPAEDLLDLLWSYCCSISVAPKRGVHPCEFCLAPGTFQVERHGKRLLLGAAEIRVFSQEGITYAAPTLIYHYVAAHHYKPPDEFLDALRSGPGPGSQEYFDALNTAQLEWTRTSKGSPKNRIFLSPRGSSADRQYLEMIGTLCDIQTTGLKLEEGRTVSFYDSSIDQLGRARYRLFEGTVHFDSEKARWYAIVDASSYRYEATGEENC